MNAIYIKTQGSDKVREKNNLHESLLVSKNRKFLKFKLKRKKN